MHGQEEAGREWQSVHGRSHRVRLGDGMGAARKTGQATAVDDTRQAVDEVLVRRRSMMAGGPF